LPVSRSAQRRSRVNGKGRESERERTMDEKKRNAAFSDAKAERRAKTLDERGDSAANATYDENTSVHARRYKVIC